jgi:hypothetical protein
VKNGTYKYQKNQKIIGTMGFFDRLKRLLTRRRAIESIQSLEPAIQSDSIASIADEKQREINEKEAMLVTSEGLTRNQRIPMPERESKPEVSIQKDSYQLGLAAGYTGKSIKEIERSLSRIETQMVTKDWFKTEFEDHTPELVSNIDAIRSLLEKHDSEVQNRFEAIQSALERTQNIASRAPEPIREGLLKEIEAIRSHIPLSGKMKELVSVVKVMGQLSYEDLATRLGITTSALRGLLSNTMKRTNEIERFREGSKGWVKYKSPR